jgi:hypothetical protein
VDASKLRRALAQFLGENQYRKFVHEGVRRGRLRYWQQQSWDAFLAAHPEYAVTLDELSGAIRVCHLHGDELLPATVEVFHGCVDYSREFSQALVKYFPKCIMPFSTEGAPFDGDTKQVRYCPTCEIAASEWAASQKRDYR